MYDNVVDAYQAHYDKLDRDYNEYLEDLEKSKMLKTDIKHLTDEKRKLQNMLHNAEADLQHVKQEKEANRDRLVQARKLENLLHAQLNNLAGACAEEKDILTGLGIETDYDYPGVSATQTALDEIARNYGLTCAKEAYLRNRIRNQESRGKSLQTEINGLKTAIENIDEDIKIAQETETEEIG